MEAARGPQDSAADGRKRAGTHSGRLLLRMPEALHSDLARASERAGVSLNGYINDVLAEAVGRRPSSSRAHASHEPARRGRRRFVERLLVVNLVVVAAVGALVVVLLVQAIR
jgi:HicB-like protein involved in pilus formation